MTSAEILKRLAHDVRGDTLRILEAAHPAWLTWAPPGTSNHMIWHAGHALWLQDLMCVRPLSGKSHLPERWEQRFGMRCQPVAERMHWPSCDELVHLLREQIWTIFQLLERVSEEQLSAPVPQLGEARNIGQWILHGLHDEAKHSGEMYLLFKLCRRASQSGSQP